MLGSVKFKNLPAVAARGRPQSRGNPTVPSPTSRGRLSANSGSRRGAHSPLFQVPPPAGVGGACRRLWAADSFCPRGSEVTASEHLSPRRKAKIQGRSPPWPRCPAAAAPVRPTGRSARAAALHRLAGWCPRAATRGRCALTLPAGCAAAREHFGAQAAQPRAPHPFARPSGSYDWPLAGLRRPFERWPLSSYGLEGFRLTRLGSPKVGAKSAGRHCPPECSGLRVDSAH